MADNYRQLELNYKLLCAEHRKKEMQVAQYENRYKNLVNEVEELCCTLIQRFRKAELNDNIRDYDSIDDLISETNDVMQHYREQTVLMFKNLCEKLDKTSLENEGLHLQIKRMESALNSAENELTRIKSNNTGHVREENNKTYKPAPVQGNPPYQNGESRRFDKKPGYDKYKKYDKQKPYGNETRETYSTSVNKNTPVQERKPEEKKEINEAQKSEMPKSEMPKTERPTASVFQKTVKERPKEEVEKPVQEVSDVSKTPMFHSTNLHDVASELTEVQLAIMECIGGKGISKTTEIVKFCEEKGIVSSATNKYLEVLKGMGYLHKEKIDVGDKWYNAYHLQDKGRSLYLCAFHKKAVESELEAMIREHSSAMHGYCVMRTAEILGVLGYKDISTSRKDNCIRLENGKSIIPDVIATSSDGKKEYFEVEIGTNNQQYFNDKCSKNIQIADVINIVVPTESKLKDNSRKIETWISKVTEETLKAAHVVVRLTTQKKLNKNEWLKVWDYSGKETGEEND